MNKEIDVKHKGKEYTLTFTRKSVERMENMGFVASDVRTKPVSVLPQLFAGAFIANHKFTPQETIDDIFETIKNKQELLSKLSEMYNDTVESLFDEPEDDEGNATWTASW